MPEMSEKFKSNPNKSNNLINIMIFFLGRVNIFFFGGGGGCKKFPQINKIPPPP